MAGDEGGLEHDVSSCASSSSDSAFAALRAAVMCHWCEAGEGRSVLTFDLSRFGHLSDKHGAGDGADTANGPQDFRGPGKSIVWADGLRDLRFQFCNLPSQKALQLVVHNSESISVSRFLMRFDLSQASFVRLDIRALRWRIFSCGRVRPASGRKAMKRATSSVSILSVLARVPLLAAKAWIAGTVPSRGP